MNFIFITWMVIQCTYKNVSLRPTNSCFGWVVFFTIYSQWPQQEKKHSYSKLMTSKINKYTIDLKGNKSLIQNKTKDYNSRSQGRQNIINSEEDISFVQYLIKNLTVWWYVLKDFLTCNGLDQTFQFLPVPSSSVCLLVDGVQGPVNPLSHRPHPI